MRVVGVFRFYAKLAKENVSLILVRDLLSERVPVSTADNNHTAIETPLFVPIRATGIVARLVGHVLCYPFHARAVYT